MSYGVAVAGKPMPPTEVPTGTDGSGEEAATTPRMDLGSTDGLYVAFYAPTEGSRHS